MKKLIFILLFISIFSNLLYATESNPEKYLFMGFYCKTELNFIPCDINNNDLDISYSLACFNNSKKCENIYKIFNSTEEIEKFLNTNSSSFPQDNSPKDIIDIKIYKIKELDIKVELIKEEKIETVKTEIPLKWILKELHK